MPIHILTFKEFFNETPLTEDRIVLEKLSVQGECLTGAVNTKLKTDIKEAIDDFKKTVSDFKIGITGSIKDRASSAYYVSDGYTIMLQLYKTADEGSIRDLEIEITTDYIEHRLNQNDQLGGGPLADDPYYYLYVVGKP